MHFEIMNILLNAFFRASKKTLSQLGLEHRTSHGKHELVAAHHAAVGKLEPDIVVLVPRAAVEPGDEGGHVERSGHDVSMSVPPPIIHLKYNTDINYDACWIHHKTILCYAKVQCQGR